MKTTSPLLALILAALIPSAATAGPYVDGKFQGRIAYSADGNHNDPDDWAASPVALAIFADGGLKDRLVHFDYNCILPKTDPAWEKIHAESVLGAAERYGYDKSKFHDCRKNLDAAVASIAKAIDDSSESNPLYFIVAGPMEVPFLGIQKSDPAKRKFVYCISHSRWNDGFASAYSFTHTKRSVIPSGINWVQIQDQNRLLSKSPYGKPGPPDSYQTYQWMRDSDDAKVRFLWERLQISTRPDPSDAGMAYFLATGDEEADPAKLKRLLDDNIVPTPVAARKSVRLEAENFRELDGYELEDENDRTASHRLCVRPTGGANATTRTSFGVSATIRTRFNEPYARDKGRYDLDIRLFVEKGKASQLALSVNGAAQGSPWRLPADGQGWMTHTVRDVEVRAGDEITVRADVEPCRLDYVQFNAR